ncbi:MAG: flagellin [Halopseudomonas aestusnigri]
MERISTFANNTALMAQALKVQSQLAEKQMESASGDKSQDYKGVAQTASQIVSLESSINRSMTYVDNGELVIGRIEVMQSSITSLIDLANNFKSDLTATLGGDNASTVGINTIANSNLEEAAATINLQVGGRYLFAGSATDQPPVSVGDPPYTAISSPSTAQDSYYSGNDDTASVQVNDKLNLEYGVAGSDSGFEKLLRAMNISANASEDPMDQAAFEEAFELLNEAMDELLVVQTELTVAFNTTERALDDQVDYQLYAGNWLDDAKTADVGQTTLELSQLEAQLEASYSATTKLINLSLTDYI